jgi:hypothetical protein
MIKDGIPNMVRVGLISLLIRFCYGAKEVVTEQLLAEHEIRR